MLTRDDFIKELSEASDDDALLIVCRRHLLHGTPFVFAKDEDAFFDFRRRIADHFHVGFHEVFIVGSAKLGFSPHKQKKFDYNSDIDVVIVSPTMFTEFMDEMWLFQLKLRQSRIGITQRELDTYHAFLEYSAMGWIRPDKIPFTLSTLKDKWFEFFRSISNNKSEVGNYKVTAGVFKSYTHLERYILEGLREVRQSQHVKEQS